MIKIQLTLALLCMIASLQVNSQDQLSETKAPYLSPESKLFWPGKEPVYLFASQSPTGANPQRLESQSTPDFANPLYLDTEGVNFIRTKWAMNKETKKPVIPQQEVLFEIYNDGLAPVTKHEFSGASRYRLEGANYYGDNLSLSLEAQDGQSGVNKTYISLDNGAYQLYSGAITLDQSAAVNIKYYSVDNVGNIENAKEVSFVVDIVAPVTSHSFIGEKTGDIVSPKTTFSLKSRDNTSGVKTTYVQIDEGAEMPYTGDMLMDFEDGDHTITYFSVDQVGNKEEPKTVKIYVDATAPEVVATVVGDQYQNRGRVFVSTRTKVKLEASDNKAGIRKVWYKIDDGPERAYTEPFELPKAKGSHTIYYYAVDNVNNDFKSLFDETKSGRQGLDIDMEAPEIDYAFGGDIHTTRDTTFITPSTEISLSAVDNDAGVKNIGYKINGGKGQPYTGPFKLEEEGFYLVDFFGTDLVNNRNAKEFFFVVDHSGPQIEVVLSSESIGSLDLDENEQSIPVYGAGLKIYLGATDKIVDTDAIYYSLNGDKEQLYTGPIKIKQKGSLTYKVKAIDNLGNSSESETYEIFIK